MHGRSLLIHVLLLLIIGVHPVSRHTRAANGRRCRTTPTRIASQLRRIADVSTVRSNEEQRRTQRDRCALVRDTAAPKRHRAVSNTDGLLADVVFAARDVVHPARDEIQTARDVIYATPDTRRPMSQFNGPARHVDRRAPNHPPSGRVDECRGPGATLATTVESIVTRDASPSRSGG